MPRFRRKGSSGDQIQVQAVSGYRDVGTGAVQRQIRELPPIVEDQTRNLDAVHRHALEFARSERDPATPGSRLQDRSVAPLAAEEAFIRFQRKLYNLKAGNLNAAFAELALCGPALCATSGGRRTLAWLGSECAENLLATIHAQEGKTATTEMHVADAFATQAARLLSGGKLTPKGFDALMAGFVAGMRGLRDSKAEDARSGESTHYPQAPQLTAGAKEATARKGVDRALRRIATSENIITTIAGTLQALDEAQRVRTVPDLMAWLEPHATGVNAKHGAKDESASPPVRDMSGAPTSDKPSPRESSPTPARPHSQATPLFQPSGDAKSLESERDELTSQARELRGQLAKNATSGVRGSPEANKELRAIEARLESIEKLLRGYLAQDPTTHRQTVPEAKAEVREADSLTRRARDTRVAASVDPEPPAPPAKGIPGTVREVPSLSPQARKPVIDSGKDPDTASAQEREAFNPLPEEIEVVGDEEALQGEEDRLAQLPKQPDAVPSSSDNGTPSPTSSASLTASLSEAAVGRLEREPEITGEPLATTPPVEPRPVSDLQPKTDPVEAPSPLEPRPLNDKAARVGETTPFLGTPESPAPTVIEAPTSNPDPNPSTPAATDIPGAVLGLPRLSPHAETSLPTGAASSTASITHTNLSGHAQDLEIHGETGLTNAPIEARPVTDLKSTRVPVEPSPLIEPRLVDGKAVEVDEITHSGNLPLSPAALVVEDLQSSESPIPTDHPPPTTTAGNTAFTQLENTSIDEAQTLKESQTANQEPEPATLAAQDVPGTAVGLPTLGHHARELMLDVGKDPDTASAQEREAFNPLAEEIEVVGDEEALQGEEDRLAQLPKQPDAVPSSSDNGTPSPTGSASSTVSLSEALVGGLEREPEITGEPLATTPPVEPRPVSDLQPKTDPVEAPSPLEPRPHDDKAARVGETTPFLGTPESPAPTVSEALTSDRDPNPSTPAATDIPGAVLGLPRLSPQARQLMVDEGMDPDIATAQERQEFNFLAEEIDLAGDEQALQEEEEEQARLDQMQEQSNAETSSPSTSTKTITPTSNPSTEIPEGHKDKEGDSTHPKALSTGEGDKTKPPEDKTRLVFGTEDDKPAPAVLKITDIQTNLNRHAARFARAIEQPGRDAGHVLQALRVLRSDQSDSEDHQMRLLRLDIDSGEFTDVQIAKLRADMPSTQARQQAAMFKAAFEALNPSTPAQKLMLASGLYLVMEDAGRWGATGPDAGYAKAVFSDLVAYSKDLVHGKAWATALEEARSGTLKAPETTLANIRWADLMPSHQDLALDAEEAATDLFSSDAWRQAGPRELGTLIARMVDAAVARHVERTAKLDRILGKLDPVNQDAARGALEDLWEVSQSALASALFKHLDDRTRSDPVKSRFEAVVTQLREAGTFSADAQGYLEAMGIQAGARKFPRAGRKKEVPSQAQDRPQETPLVGPRLAASRPSATTERTPPSVRANPVGMEDSAAARLIVERPEPSARSGRESLDLRSEIAALIQTQSTKEGAALKDARRVGTGYAEQLQQMEDPERSRFLWSLLEAIATTTSNIIPDDDETADSLSSKAERALLQPISNAIGDALVTRMLTETIHHADEGEDWSVADKAIALVGRRRLKPAANRAQATIDHHGPVFSALDHLQTAGSPQRLALQAAARIRAKLFVIPGKTALLEEVDASALRGAQGLAKVSAPAQEPPIEPVVDPGARNPVALEGAAKSDRIEPAPLQVSLPTSPDPEKYDITQSPQEARSLGHTAMQVAALLRDAPLVDGHENWPKLMGQLSTLLGVLPHEKRSLSLARDTTSGQDVHWITWREAGRVLGSRGGNVSEFLAAAVDGVRDIRDLEELMGGWSASLDNDALVDACVAAFKFFLSEGEALASGMREEAFGSILRVLKDRVDQALKLRAPSTSTDGGSSSDEDNPLIAADQAIAHHLQRLASASADPETVEDEEVSADPASRRELPPRPATLAGQREELAEAQRRLEGLLRKAAAPRDEMFPWIEHLEQIDYEMRLISDRARAVPESRPVAWETVGASFVRQLALDQEFAWAPFQKNAEIHQALQWVMENAGSDSQVVGLMRGLAREVPPANLPYLSRKALESGFASETAAHTALAIKTLFESMQDRLAPHLHSADQEKRIAQIRQDVEVALNRVLEDPATRAAHQPLVALARTSFGVAETARAKDSKGGRLRGS